MRLQTIIIYLLLSLCLAYAKEKRAFITVVTTEEDVEPAMAIGTLLRASTRTKDSVHNSAYSLDYICLVLRKEEFEAYKNPTSDQVTGGVSLIGMKKLTFSGWTTRPVSYSIFNDNYKGANWSQADFNTMWIWAMSEYDKVVYLNHDVLVFKDIKDLFSRNVNFAAAPKPFASHQFDSGLMLIKPNMSTFTELMNELKRGIDGSWNLDVFLNNYYSAWYTMGANHRLSPYYNAPYSWTQDESWVQHRKDIRALHFLGDEKPSAILKNPKKYNVSKYGAPFIYIWAIILFFIANPLEDGFEDETRHVLQKVFDITKSSKAVAEYIEKMKRGGTRLRISIHDDADHDDDEFDEL